MQISSTFMLASTVLITLKKLTVINNCKNILFIFNNDQNVAKTFFMKQDD